MKLLVWISLISLGAIAVAFGLVKGEEFFFYEEVQAEAVKIVPVCLFKPDGPKAKLIGPLNCEKARKRESAMRLKNYTLVENRRVYFKFISPVDNQEHKGSIIFSSTAENLPTLGETQTYLASKKHKKRLKPFA